MTPHYRIWRESRKGLSDLFIRQLAISWAIAIIISEKLWQVPSLNPSLAFAAIGIIVYCFGLRDFAKKRIDQAVSQTKLHLIGWSFLIFTALQSPVGLSSHPPGDYHQYYFLKFFSITVLIYLQKKGRVFLFLCAACALYVVDSEQLCALNNYFCKTRTEWFSVSVAIIASLVALALVNLAPGEEHESDRNGLTSTGATLILCVSALYLANYPTAFFAKISLEGPPLQWLFNETLITAQRAQFSGLSVINPRSTDLFYDYHGRVVEILMNGLTLIMQAAVVLIFISRKSILILIGLEFFHVVVGLTAGVWFYKWILVNLIIILNYKASWELQLNPGGFLRKLCLLVVCLSGSIMSAVPLGWYEIRQGDILKAKAVFKSGEEIYLHPHFFGSASFFMLSKTQRAFDYETVGTHHAVASYPTMLKSKSCEFSVQMKKHEAWWRNTTTEITSAILSQGPIENVIHILQPYHILIPNLSLQTRMKEDIKKVIFEKHTVCFDGARVVSATIDQFEVENGAR